MVRALLDGRKSQTRRLAWRQRGNAIAATFWQQVRPGDRLWVRENFAYVGGGDPGILLYGATWREDAIRAGCDQPVPGKPPKLTSCIHMPRKLSRLTLDVSKVRLQKLQGIDGIDALAEGITRVEGVAPWRVFLRLWNSLHGEGAWQSNPEVVAISFTVAQSNIDALARAA